MALRELEKQLRDRAATYAGEVHQWEISKKHRRHGKESHGLALAMAYAYLDAAYMVSKAKERT